MRRLVRLKESRCIVAGLEHGFGHAIEQQARELQDLFLRGLTFEVQGVANATLDSPHRSEVAGVRDVGGLARPR